MQFSYVSLDPVPVTRPTAENAHELRTHQGIPSIERSAGGRLFAVWYTGGGSECMENYVMLVMSDDDGETWSDAVAVISPEHPQVRAFDPNIWMTPDGRLFIFWAQSCGGENGKNEIFDGIGGVFFSELENPDDAPENFRFSESRRIANGIMMDKPTVLSDGTWAFPCSVWTGNYRKHESLDVIQGAWLVASEDGGRTFSRRGYVDMHDVEGGCAFDEHIYVEHKDGKLVCYIRVRRGIAESESLDGGRTWSSPKLSETIDGVDSRFFIRRLKSGNLLMVKNDTEGDRSEKAWNMRKLMTAWISEDDGKTWPYSLLLDGASGSVSYPDGVEAPDGTLYIIHDYARVNGGYVIMSRITEEDIKAGKLVSLGSKLMMLISKTRPVPGNEWAEFPGR